MFKAGWHFRFFVIAVIAALILPEIFREGIFMDGNLYSSVAVNFARGNGSFWSPHFAEESMSFFHEQPPLMFGMLGLCYKLFGENYLVERFYSLSIFVVSLLVFLRIWKELFRNDEKLLDMKWVAALIWMMIPNAPWVVIHNLEENTMGLFVLLSVLLIVKSGTENKISSQIAAIILSSICLSLAFLCKGFPGLFPLALLPLFFASRYNGMRGIYLLLFLIQLATLTLVALLLFSYEPSKTNLLTWLNERVLNSIKNVSTSNNRFWIMWFLLMQLLPVAAFTLVLFILNKVERTQLFKLDREQKKKAFIFLVLAICGSLPLIVTREQRGFYLATSFPYYAISIAIFISPLVNVLSSENWQKSIRFFRSIPFVLGAVVIVVTIILLPYPKRDQDKVHDHTIIAKKLEYGSFLTVAEGLWNDWELQTAMVRLRYVSLTPDKNKSNYYIGDKNLTLPADTTGYSRAEWNLQRYIVWEKKE